MSEGWQRGISTTPGTKRRSDNENCNEEKMDEKKSNSGQLEGVLKSPRILEIAEILRRSTIDPFHGKILAGKSREVVDTFSKQFLKVNEQSVEWLGSSQRFLGRVAELPVDLTRSHGMTWTLHSRVLFDYTLAASWWAAPHSCHWFTDVKRPLASAGQAATSTWSESID